jgi:O-glycosyl hydrolase
MTRSTRRRVLAGALTLALAGAGGVAAVTLAPAPARAQTLVQVSASPAQTIHSIGASGAWWVNDVGRFFSTANQQRVADLLFGQNGLRLSAYRYNIGGGGVGVADTDRKPETFLVSPGSYDWSRDRGGVAFLRYADQMGVPTIVGFVNSAPPVWTTNAQSCGGTLRAGSEQALATYLADIVTHFDAEGVRMTHLSPFNEPGNSFAGSPCSQEGMLVPVGQRDDVVRALGTTVRSRAPWIGITSDESSSTGTFNSEAPQWMSQSGTAPHVAALAHHTYDFPSDATRAGAGLVGKRFGKPTWASEICCFGSGGGWGQGYDPTIGGALAMSSIMYRDLAVAGDSAFHWWTAVSKVMGCSPGGNAACAASTNTSGWNDGLLYYDPQFASNGNQSIYFTKRYYVMGQYSRYVRPGAVRHAVTGTPGGVQILATSGGGNWTLVVTNNNTGAANLNVHFNALENVTPTGSFRTSATESLATVANPSVANGTASMSVPGRSVTTYVLRQNGGAPVVASPTSRWIGQSSGRCVDVSGGSATNGANIIIWGCHSNTNQQWTTTAAGELRVFGTKCLEAYQAGTAAGTRASIFDCNGGNHQKWNLNADNTITNRQSGLCLDVNGQGTADGTGVILWNCSGGANQIWRRA